MSGVTPKYRNSLALWCVGLGCLSTVVTGCRVQTDLGTPCTLVRRDPQDTDPSDGINSIPILESEVATAVEGGRDYISFGATECEDLVCVRDRNFVATREQGAPAEGYCSKPCAPTLTNQCPPANEADSKDPARALNCRPMLLDQDSLNALRDSDPEKYRRYFGETTTPDFCARGNDTPSQSQSGG